MEQSIKDKAIQRLVERRKELKKALDHLIAEPASVSIIGSVSYTNRNLDDLRSEITKVEEQIRQLVFTNAGSLTRIYPNYRG